VACSPALAWACAVLGASFLIATIIEIVNSYNQCMAGTTSSSVTTRRVQAQSRLAFP
jgi:hypothetical protein